MGRVARRFLFEYVYCRHAGAAGLECGNEGAGGDQLRPAGVDEERSGLHADEILGIVTAEDFALMVNQLLDEDSKADDERIRDYCRATCAVHRRSSRR
jgi:hypothetical protein